MRVISGAGEFEIEIDRVVHRDGSLILTGKMGVWDSETYISREDLAHIVAVSLNRPTLWYLAKAVPAGLWRTLRSALRRRRAPVQRDEPLR